ncbi:MAG: PilN domain-containing protein [Chitinispirillaceae bacterium]|nr:PilN domain-containing protein [Chitinispirillaceae bacterium]
MIRINLLAYAAGKKPSFAVPWRRVVKPVVIALMVVAAVGVTVSAVRWGMKRLKTIQTTAAQKKSAVKPDIPQSQEKTSAVTEAEPLTQGSHAMVEEVVNDMEVRTDQGPSDVLAELSYREMSRGEQINYEHDFSKNVMRILTRAVPEGIGFRSLSIDSFQTVTATGEAMTKSQVTELFRNLRNEKFDLSLPPQSYITSGGKKGYRFSFTCEVPLGTNPVSSWLLTDHLKSRRQLGSSVRSFSQRASRNGIILKHGLTHIKTYKTGAWRRSVYHMAGKGSYRSFMRFLLELNEAHVPCAFSRINLRARTSNRVDISADVIFTMRD